MCLKIKKGTEISTAEKPIKCFKVLRIGAWVQDIPHYFTPYCATYVREDIIDGECAFYASKNIIINDYGRHYGVENGFIHTYASKEAAIRDAIWLKPSSVNSNGKPKYAIFQCEIPTGTEYFKGTTGITPANPKKTKASFVDVVSYASKQIVFKEKIYEI